MPFREKSAWISLVVMLGVFGVFYGAILTGRLPTGGVVTVQYLLISVAAAAVLQVVLHLVAALLTADSGGPQDERERLIELRATRLAYGVLVAGVLVGLFVTIHLPHGIRAVGVPEVALTALGAVIFADIVKSAASIIRYRLGA